MVRDIESLIEFLYLKSIDSTLDFDRIIVNPQQDDIVLGKTCILNKCYDYPDLHLAEDIINRFTDPYNHNANRFIRFIPVLDDNLFVTIKDNIFYFGVIPPNLIMDGNCYDYLEKQRQLLLR